MKIYAVKTLNLSEEQLCYLCSIISPEKKYEIKGFKNKKDKIKKLIGELLIRDVLIEQLNISNKDLQFDKNKYGKPFLKNYPQVKFNISHSGEFVVCAIDDKDIGIDIEKIKNIEYKEIGENFLSLDESKYIIENELSLQLSKFYEIWTLKESYIKCCGKGLSIPLKSFSINIDKYRNIRISNNEKYSYHIFKMFNIDSDYKMAVCSINKEITNNIIRMNQKSLIDNYLASILR